MSELSKETIKKLKAVKAAILANPKFYNQGQWIESVTPCGTTCCIAGWADFVVNGSAAHNRRAKAIRNDSSKWMRIAREALGITEDQVDKVKAIDKEVADEKKSAAAQQAKAEKK